jgi:hypothetical protein
MRSIKRVLLLAAVATAALSVAAVPTEAAKKKQAAAKGCALVSTCAANCKGNACELRTCGSDGRLYTPFLTRACTQPNCPAKC